MSLKAQYAQPLRLSITASRRGTEEPDRELTFAPALAAFTLTFFKVELDVYHFIKAGV